MKDEIMPLSAADFDIEALERRLEMTAMLVDPVQPGDCTTFTPQCGTLSTCGTFG